MVFAIVLDSQGGRAEGGRPRFPGLEAHDLLSPEPVLAGVRWHVSRHVFEHGAATYPCALATDVSDAVVVSRLGSIPH